MKYLSAQPDQPYFLWQLKVQISNFASLGIEEDLIILLATEGEPSADAQHLKAHTSAQVHFIPDTRADRSYAPSVQFFLYSRFFETHKIGQPYMLVDSDVILMRPLKVDHLLADDIVYMSDTRSYLGFEYLMSKGEEQLATMARMVGIGPGDVWVNDDGAGGAQTIMKGHETPTFWKKVEADALMLYKYMTIREPLWQGDGYPIQRWTAGMWAFLWNLWLSGAKTVCAPELAFCWGSDPVYTKQRARILHLAGVTSEMRETHFYKGDYMNKSPLDMDILQLQHLTQNPLNMSQVYLFEVLLAKDHWDKCSS